LKSYQGAVCLCIAGGSVFNYRIGEK